MPSSAITEQELIFITEEADQSVLSETLETTIFFTVGHQGPPGPTGTSGSAAYTHTQSSAADTWTVNHNLGFRPAASILSVGGKEMLAEVIHTSVNQFIAYFDAPISGVAICS